MALGEQLIKPNMYVRSGCLNGLNQPTMRAIESFKIHVNSQVNTRKVPRKHDFKSKIICTTFKRAGEHSSKSVIGKDCIDDM